MTENATTKFRLGQRVRLTEAGERVVGSRRHHRARAVGSMGTVRGFGREPQLVRVVRDGCKTVNAWHANFWEPLAVDGGHVESSETAVPSKSEKNTASETITGTPTRAGAS